jgi:predicted TIM-barrel fold metal-dependent hydrolase
VSRKRNSALSARRPNEQQLNKANKGKRSTSAAAREIAAAVRELKLAGQTINKVRRRMSPSAAAREIAAAVKDLGVATHAIYKAVRHMGKAVQIRQAQIRSTC